MNIKKICTLPIVFSMSAILVTLLAESNLHLYLIKSELVKSYCKASDAKTLTFMIPALTVFLTFFVMEVAIFVLPRQKSQARRRCKKLKAKMANIYSLIFMMTLTAYILKVNDTSLMKFTLTAMVLSQLYMVGLLVRSSVVHFIFLAGIYYSLGLLFCFAFMKYFALGYQMSMMFVKSLF